MTDSKEIKVREKQELTTPAEQTTPGIVFSPQVDIFETDKEITLLADIPGVKSEMLNIDLRDNILTITGTSSRRGPPTRRMCSSNSIPGDSIASSPCRR